MTPSPRMSGNALRAVPPLLVLMLFITGAAEAATRTVHCGGGQCATTCGVAGDCSKPCSDSDFSSLQRADQCTATGDTLVLQCGSRFGCYYDKYEFSGVRAGDNVHRTGVTVRSEPLRMAVFANRSLPKTSGAVIPPALIVSRQAHDWRFEGIVVDGQRHTIISNNVAVVGGPAFLLTASNGVTFSKGKVRDSIGNCIELAYREGSAPNITYSPIYNTTIEYSELSRCLHWGNPALTAQQNARLNDASGIYSGVADGLVVRGNLIHHFSGDGVQLDIIRNADNTQNIPGLWGNVLIADNRIYSDPLSELSGTSPGENGIDAKPGKGPITITGNTVFGFRGYAPATQQGKGTSDSKGEAIILHGRYTHCALSGTPSASPGQYCGLVERNDISDSNIGISVGLNTVHQYAGTQGSAPRAIFVRRNIIHDLSPDAPHEDPMDKRTWGVGIRLNNTGNSTLGHQLFDFVVFEHNTVANTPGAALYQSDRASNSPGGGPEIRNACFTCGFRYNIVSFAGNQCSGSTRDVLTNYQGNLCAPSALATPECGAAGNNTPVGNIGFTGAKPAPPTCGDPVTYNPNAVTAYEYALAGGSPAVDPAQGETGPGACGLRMDTGALEGNCPPAPGLTVSRMPEFYHGLDSSWPSHLTVSGGTLYFVAKEGEYVTNLYRSNGTPLGTSVLQPFQGILEAFIDVGGRLYFMFGPAPGYDRQLWKSDGTSASTQHVPTNYSPLYPSYPRPLIGVGNTVFFMAHDFTAGAELWKSDGTASGTGMIKDIFPSPYGYGPEQLFRAGGMLYFSWSDGTHGMELWKSDGTAPGTVMVKDVLPGGIGSQPEMLGDVNGTLFFAAGGAAVLDGERYVYDLGLWKSDGTAAGTVLVKDLAPGYAGSVGEAAVVGSTLFFIADDGVHGRELWKSDGTTAGTVLVKDIRPGLDGAWLSDFEVVGGTLYFSADDGTSGAELWKSDGTAAGTVRVRDICAGPQYSAPRELTAVGGLVYFSANDCVSGTELWKSDGTQAGTTRVSDLWPGAASSNPSTLTAYNGALYFSADNGASGAELWKVTCAPTTCAAQGASCGTVADGCGGTLTCGAPCG